MKTNEMTIRLRTYALFSGLLMFASGCGFAPVSSSFESARTLGKGNNELMGNYSAYYSEADFGEMINFNYGMRLGIGLNNKTDLKFRYERLTSVCFEEYGANTMNYISIEPKFGSKSHNFSFTPGLSLYFVDYAFIPTISPKFIFTASAGEYFDFSLINRFELFITSGGAGASCNINLGMGIGKLDTWAFRPEIGWNYMLGADNLISTAGIGFCYTIKSSGKNSGRRHLKSHAYRSSLW